MRKTAGDLLPREGPRKSTVSLGKGSCWLALITLSGLISTGTAQIRPRGSHRRVALCCAPLVAAFAFVEQGGRVKPQIIERGQFTVIGIEVRTNNAEAATVIPQQWNRFFKEGLLDKIPNKTDTNTLAVYSNYASDRRGDFDYMIGARVEEGSKAPEGMIVKLVLKARYAVLTTAQGQVGKVVSEGWQKIWNLEDIGRLGGRRTYKADFEVYDQRSRDPNSSQVDIYVGIERQQ